MLPKGRRPQPWLAYRRGRGPALCLERSRRAPALWRRGEVQLDRLAAGTRARLGGEFLGAGLKDLRRDLLGAVDADPSAEHPAARAVTTRLVRCQSEALTHHASTLASGAAAAAFMMRPTTMPSASTLQSSSPHPPDRREAEARLRISWPMSAPGPRMKGSAHLARHMPREHEQGSRSAKVLRWFAARLLSDEHFYSFSAR